MANWFNQLSENVKLATVNGFKPEEDRPWPWEQGCVRASSEQIEELWVVCDGDYSFVF